MKSWNDRARAAFAQGGNTYSKLATQYIEGVTPTHIEDVKAKESCKLYPAESLYGMVDYVCGLGSNLIDIRNNFSLPSTQEVVLAERIKDLFPCIHKMKLVKTGSAACSAAVRIARAYTGRMLVWGTGYHGTDNWAISAEEPGTGTVFEFYQKFGSLDGLLINLRKVPEGDQQLAAVIIEPVQLDMDVGTQLLEIRQICTDKKIVLIFDEVITGFRFPKYCVANHFGIQPDLICLGKALGNGYPIALVGGKDEIMETPGYFISNTHNGELSAIGAALDTLDFLTEAKIRDLWDRGSALNTEFNKLTPKLKMVGYPTRSELQGDEAFRALFLQEMVKAGHFFGRARFLTFAHTWEVILETLRVCRSVIAEIESGGVKLEGLAPRPIFKRN